MLKDQWGVRWSCLIVHILAFLAAGGTIRSECWSRSFSNNPTPDHLKNVNMSPTCGARALDPEPDAHA